MNVILVPAKHFLVINKFENKLFLDINGFSDI